MYFLHDNMANLTRQLSDFYNFIWEKRDSRADGLFLLNSPVPTVLICLTYVYLVKIWGPNYMKTRKPLNLNRFLIWYNALQVVLSAYLFVQILRGGWWGDYSFRCQPVDYSNNPKALLMLHATYFYYLSKFTEFIDTFCFVAKKKDKHVSMLHVVHHGTMPLCGWIMTRFTPGGHSTFGGLLNSFVHVVMYFYYMLAAMGPKYQRYIWWKQHLTTLQVT